MTEALVGVLVVGVTVAQTRPEVADVLKCKRLEVVDEQGKIRAAVTVDEAGPSLSLWDAQGKVRAGLGVSEAGTGLTLSDAQGKVRAGLAVFEAGSGLMLSDAQGKPRAGLAVPEDGPAALALFDAQGQGRAVPESSIRLYGPDGYVSWSAP